MAFKFCDAMIHDYRTRGCVVFRQILPPSLLRDLRRATARTQEVARARFGPQVQRLKVTGDSGIDLQPFREYAELPALVDAVGRLLTPRHKIDEDFSRASVLLEPSEMPGVPSGTAISAERPMYRTWRSLSASNTTRCSSTRSTVRSMRTTAPGTCRAAICGTTYRSPLAAAEA